jgi:hypothetical protein
MVVSVGVSVTTGGAGAAKVGVATADCGGSARALTGSTRMSDGPGAEAASPRETSMSDRPSKAAPPYFTKLDNRDPLECAVLVDGTK